MLKKKNRLVKNKDFKDVFKKGFFSRDQYLSLKALKTDSLDTRIGFIVSKKLSKKAVSRNKVKRCLREIFRLKIEQIKSGYDIIILPNIDILNKNFKSVEQIVDNLLIKSKLLK